MSDIEYDTFRRPSESTTEREQRHREEEPDQLDELIEMLRDVRDRAHWLAVHRRMKLAEHIELVAAALVHMAVDLRGRRARGEKL